VQVVVEKDLLNTDEDDNSAKVSLASITCIKRTNEEDKSKVLVQKEKTPIEHYTPPHMRRKGTNHNSPDGKPMISFGAITKK
jgi:hypothetical protein